VSKLKEGRELSQDAQEQILVFMHNYEDAKE
jgi:hypothetical protein